MARTNSVQESRPKRAALYVRVSSDRQEEDGTSLETQEAACRRYAAEHGYTVTDTDLYREVFTGVELWARPKLTLLRELVRRREIDAVIAYAIDRLARDPVHLGVIISEAEHANVEVFFVTEPLDHSPEGQLIRFVRGYAAKVEHEKIKERTVRGKRARLESGRLLPGSAPLYGYRWRDETHSAYEHDPATVPIVRRIWRELAGGATLRGLAKKLTDEGIPPPGRTREGVWRFTTIRAMVRNARYAGIANGWDSRGSTIAPIPLPEGLIPPLVDVATLNAVQQRLILNRLRSSRRNQHPELALLHGGYARCGYCGAVMRHKPSRPRHPAQYACNRYGEAKGCTSHAFNVERLDALVWERVRQVLLTPETIAAELSKLEAQDPTSDDLAAVDRSLAEIERQQRNLVDQLANIGSAVAELVTQKLNTLQRQREQLDAERAAILGRRSTWAAARDRLKDLEAWCRTVATNLDGLTYDERRLALDALGVEVRVYRADHAPRYEIFANVPLDAPIVLGSSESARPACRRSRTRCHPPQQAVGLGVNAGLV